MKYLILLILLSCGVTKKSQEAGLETVSLNTVGDQGIVINEADPPVSSSIKDNEEEKSKLKVSLSVYATLYNSLALLSYLKELEKNEIEITRIIATDFSILISALYAKDKSLSTAEWKLFGLLKLLNNEKIHTKGWYEIVEEFTKKEFNSLKVSDLKIPLSVPEIDGKKLAWDQSQLVKDLILKNINLLNKSNYVLNPQIYDHKIRELAGIHFHHSIAFLDKPLQLELQDGFRWGVLTNYLSFIKKNENISKMNTQSQTILDKLYPLTSYQDFYSKDITENIEKLKNDITSQSELNTPSSF